MTIMNFIVLSFCFLFFLVYAMSFVFFFLLVYVCVHVWTCMIVRECIRISSPGTCDQPNPPKILSNATIFVQPALACALCCTPNIADGRDSKAWFPKTTPAAQLATLVLRLFCSFFYEENVLQIGMVTGNGKWKQKAAVLPTKPPKKAFFCVSYL